MKPFTIGRESVTTIRTLLSIAWERGIRFEPFGDRLRLRGRSSPSPELLDAIKANKLQIMEELARRERCRLPLIDVQADREAVQERAAIIAEGCGISQDEALLEALWQSERDSALDSFKKAGDFIMAAPEHARMDLLREYQARMVEKHGPKSGADMGKTMRGWVRMLSEAWRGEI